MNPIKKSSDQFKNALLYMLEDSDVQEKIRSIVKRRMIGSEDHDFQSDLALRKQTEGLTTQPQSKGKQIGNLSIELKAREEHIEQLRAKIAVQNQQLEQYQADVQEMGVLREQLRQWEGSFSTVLSLYHQYTSLDIELKNTLSNIICSKDILSFICSCSQIDHLNSLWEYIRNKIIIDAEDPALQLLICIFNEFLQIINNAESMPKYCLDQDTLPGQIYDDDYHCRYKNSKVTGRISRVVLRGYRSVMTDRAVKKTVVVVE